MTIYGECCSVSAIKKERVYYSAIVGKFTGCLFYGEFNASAFFNKPVFSVFFFRIYDWLFSENGVWLGVDNSSGKR